MTSSLSSRISSFPLHTPALRTGSWPASGRMRADALHPVGENDLIPGLQRTHELGRSCRKLPDRNGPNHGRTPRGWIWRIVGLHRFMLHAAPNKCVPIGPGRQCRECSHAGAGGRVGRARARAVLGDRGEPAADEAVVRAGQSRHRRGRRPACRSARMDIAALVDFARDNAIDLVVPGPEAPLVAGITDAMEAAGIAVLRPVRARPRSSKAARPSPRRSATPPASRPRAGSGSTTPRRRANSSAAAARRSWSRRTAWPPARASWSPPPRTRRWPRSTPSWSARAFGDAGAAVVIEECLIGDEVSLFALCDGDARAAAGLGAGPQAGRRRRHRPEHRRHGRLCADADVSAGAGAGGDGRASSARRWPRWRAAARRSAACCSPG